MSEPAPSTRIAIMQGRLGPPVEGRFQSFPRDDWAAEFPRAATARLDAIEWIYDAFGEDANPLATDAGIARMRELSQEHGVAVVSSCADYFMDHPFVRAGEAERRALVERLLWLLERARSAGIGRIVLPFVDASRIADDDDRRVALAVLRAALPAAARAGVELHLETDLDPAAFAGLLADLQHAHLKVNYDSGNSASLGYAPAAEFAAYGERIGSVHIKDRRLGGGTVALGSGDADLPAVFGGLRRLGYRGDFVLQAARPEPGAEVQRAGEDAAFVRRAWQAAGERRVAAS
jgi:hexulose-6-phosphate isomerase